MKGGIITWLPLCDCAASRTAREPLGLSKQPLPSRGTRRLDKSHMLHNTACLNITVNAQTAAVMTDGKAIGREPARVVPLSQRYMLR